MTTEKNPDAETADAIGSVLDQFDPASLRIDQDFAAVVGVEKALTIVPTRKPDKSWFVRVRTGDDYRLTTMVLELKEDRETYLIAPGLRQHLATETTIGIRQIVTAINRQGVLFLWPLALPTPDGKTNPWHQSALDAAGRATQRWIRIQPNMALGAYEVHVANGTLPEPIWPKHSFRDLLSVAFRDRFIETLDHPVLQRLRGEV